MVSGRSGGAGSEMLLAWLRKWSAEAKAEIVAESLVEGAIVSEAA